MTIALLTQSRARAARLCARYHHLRYVLRYQAVESREELEFGTVVHFALADWWASKDLDASLAHLAPLEPFARARAEAMIRGYHVRWGDEPLEAVSIEQSFECALVNPDTSAESKLWRLAGKLDVVVRNTATGLKHLVEHKTSSDDVSPGSYYVRKLRLDTQVSIYFDGAAALGHEVDSCIYDVLGKISIRPHKATPEESRKYTKTGALYASQRANDETVDEYLARCVECICAEPERYYQRLDVVRLEGELVENRRDIWQLAQRCREDERLDRAPRNPEACLRNGGKPCEFFDVCTGAASLDDPNRFKSLTDAHPELAPDASATPASTTERAGQQ